MSNITTLSNMVAEELNKPVEFIEAIGMEVEEVNEIIAELGFKAEENKENELLIYSGEIGDSNEIPILITTTFPEYKPLFLFVRTDEGTITYSKAY